MQTGITIRPVQDDDVPTLIALWHAAGVARPWNDPATDIAFARRGPHSTILVGVQDGTISASAMVGEDGHRGWVYYVAVDPAQQRGGLGAAIMAAAEDWLRARGIWKLQLLVRADNKAAHGFYQRLGYHDTGAVCFQKVIAG